MILRVWGLAIVLLGASLVGLAAGRVMLGPSGLAEVTRILPTPEGIWAAGYGYGVWRQTSHGWRRETGHAQDERFITDIAHAADGTLYASTWQNVDGLLAISPRTGQHRMIRWDQDSPGFNFGDMRATRAACLGNDVLLNTFAGIARYRSGQGWTRWGGRTENYALFATPAGCWTIINENLIRINRSGRVDRNIALKGVVNLEDVSITCLWVQGNHVLFGDSTGVLHAVDVGHGQITTVSRPPQGVTAALVDILPVGQTIYLAYGQAGVPQEKVRGGVALYDRLMGHTTSLDAFANDSWHTLALVHGEVWVGGRPGIARVPAPLKAPVITRSHGEPIVLLSDTMRAALQRTVPGFTPCPWWHYSTEVTAHYHVTEHQIPSAVLGDFNADGHPDAVLQGYAGKKFYELCLLSHGQTYSVIIRLTMNEPTLTSTSPDESKHFYNLTYIPPGHYSHLYDGPLTLHTDAFDEVAEGKASVIVYMRHGRLLEHAESD